MKAVYKEFKEADNKKGAVLDIIRRNNLGWAKLPASKKILANSVRADLQEAYGDRVYAPNPRDTFIAIKVAGKYPRTKSSVALANAEARVTQLGGTKVRTEQGVIYRIPV